VQDYHFALLPRMIRDRLPNATIITFWHIPWPNPEAFAICPWRRELLDGLAGLWCSLCGHGHPAITAAVSELLPFSAPSLERVRARPPRWDVEDQLADPPPGGGWPGESEIRLACRQPVYALERSVVASLGFDGDLLLGWRAGDAIAADLA
jgi:hypothetical protein